MITNEEHIIIANALKIIKLKNIPSKKYHFRCIDKAINVLRNKLDDEFCVNNNVDNSPYYNWGN
jgi:hypothetical protein